MKDKFYVGQRVRLVSTADITPTKARVGMICAITAPRTYQRNCRDDLLLAYDVHADGEIWIFEEHNLAPVYDGDQKTSWSECAWQPLKEPVMT